MTAIQLSEPVARALQQTLAKNEPFNIEGSTLQKPQSRQQWLQWKISGAHQTKNNESLYNLFLIALKEVSQKPRNEVIGQEANSPILESVKFFLRRKNTLSKQKKADLFLHLSAAKLGLPIEALTFNPDFRRFAEKSHLHRRLGFYNHSLQYDNKTHTISILYQGKPSPWQEVKKELKIDDDGNFSGQYLQKGLQKNNYFQWKKWTPFAKKDPAEWGRRYIFEIYSWRNEPEGFSDNHSWFRLKTPEGDIYSVGDFPSDKGQSLSRVKFPARIKAGRLQSPDYSEFWGGGHFSPLAFAITKQQFESIKKLVEEDKKRSARPYQLFNKNCSSYALKMARLAGVNIPASIPFHKAISPSFAKKISVIKGHLPKIIQKIITISYNIFANIFLFFLGASVVEKQVQEGCQKSGSPKATPYLSSFSDLLKPPKVDHPLELVRIFEEIQQWREKHIKQKENDKSLTPEKRKEAIETLRFAIPKKYRIA